MHRDLQRAVGGGGDILGELADVDRVKGRVAIGRRHVPCLGSGGPGKAEDKGEGGGGSAHDAGLPVWRTAAARPGP